MKNTLFKIPTISLLICLNPKANSFTKPNSNRLILQEKGRQTSTKLFSNSPKLIGSFVLENILHATAVFKIPPHQENLQVELSCFYIVTKLIPHDKKMAASWNERTHTV